MPDGIIDDLKTAWNDATTTQSTDGDVAASAVDGLHTIPGVGTAMDALGIEKGKSYKADVDNWENENGLTAPAQSGELNTGNQIGAGVGGALGAFGGAVCPALAPAMIASGMGAGSRLGGWIGNLF